MNMAIYEEHENHWYLIACLIWYPSLSVEFQILNSPDCCTLEWKVKFHGIAFTPGILQLYTFKRFLSPGYVKRFKRAREESDNSTDLRLTLSKRYRVSTCMLHSISIHRQTYTFSYSDPLILDAPSSVSFSNLDPRRSWMELHLCMIQYSKVNAGTVWGEHQQATDKIYFNAHLYIDVLSMKWWNATQFILLKGSNQSTLWLHCSSCVGG